MADILTEKTDKQRWTKLYKQWLAERKPGQVIEAGGRNWKVVQLALPDGVGDEREIGFIPAAGFDEHYAGTTKGLSP